MDNTLIFYIWGDNGSSAEGLNGTISEQLAQNGIPTRISQHLEALQELGGLDALGGPKTDNMYHAAWAWAGSTPYKSTKLVGAHFGGTRQPMAVSWPKGIRPDATPRAQFHHVNDIVPTIYEVTKISPPRVVHGVPQDSMDGISMAYTFADASAKGRKATQFFDIMASRGIYHEGWFASAMGPREPWVGGIPKGARDWSPEKDVWELYNLEEDWSQAHDLAAQMPEKLARMKELLLVESTRNGNLPIGGGLKALGGSLTDNIYHAGWAWAGSTPFRHTKLVASHFGGTRNPLVVSWPKSIKPDRTPRSQFYHVNDVAPTIYDILGIKAPTWVNGFQQDPIDGVSMATSFGDAKAPERKQIQYSDNNGSDGIYHDGWYACTFGPLVPWLNAQKGLAEWDSSKAVSELYDLTRDFSQMNNLAAQRPEKVEEMKKLFLAQAKENQVFPIGAGIWLRLHPEDRIKTPYTSWSFDDTTTRMPEFTAPAVGNHNNTLAIELECGAVAGAWILSIIAGGQAGFTTASGFAANGYGEHSPGKYAMMSGFIGELVLTFFFLIIILGATDPRAPKGFAPIAIGLGLMLIHLIGIPLTNLSVNPARSVGPAVFVGGWAIQQLWLFWVAPILGAILAGVVYPIMAGRPTEQGR